MHQKSKVHWDLPRIPENDFLFSPRYDIKEYEDTEAGDDRGKELNGKRVFEEK